MTEQQGIALGCPTFLAVEAADPRFKRVADGVTSVMTVNAGYECIEQRLGGPVWHVSVSTSLGANNRQLFALAMTALNGVGSIRFGQWREHTKPQGRRVYHLKRRLVASEAALCGAIRDIRGTQEATERFGAVRQWLPPGWTNVM